jgi:alanyl aminopeptidase
MSPSATEPLQCPNFSRKIPEGKIIMRCVLIPLLLALAACGPSEQADDQQAGKPAREQPVTSKPAAPVDARAEKAATVKKDEAIEAPAGRLPRDVRPKAYRVDLMLDPRRDGFTGKVEIDVELHRSSDRIWIHGRGLNMKRISAFLPDGNEVLADYREVLDSGVALVRFAETLPAGTLTLRMEYGAAFDRNLAGLFKVEEQGDAYVLAKSESIQARKYLPGFDEPGMKATFDIVLTVPAGYAAISNGAELKREPVGEGLERVTFNTTRLLPTYLLSLSVGPFDLVECPAIPPNKYRSQPIPLRGFARKGQGDDMSYVLEITPRMLAVFEEQLQQPYPYEKLDIVAAPQWPSGATELAAAITYHEQAILTGDNPAPGARMALLDLHSHEISHMWFGNLVTPPWWDDLWLKEGFATWGTPLALTVLEPDGGHDLNAAVDAVSAMRLDSLASTRAIREPVTDNNNIRNAYDAITYSKSLGVIHMVDQYFGPEIFRPAVGRYIKTFGEGTADSPDFYRVIGEETATPELTETFRSFVEQKGVPFLDVAVDCGNNGEARILINQNRYKPLGSPIADSDQMWNIPLCFSSDSGGQQCQMLTTQTQAIAVSGGDCPKWVLPNARGSGYYRWSLPESSWESLLDRFVRFEAAEQLSIVDSAFAGFEADKVPAAFLLQVAEKSAGAEKRQVVLAPLRYLEKYRKNYADAGTQPAFLKFVQDLYQPVLERTAGSKDSDEKLLHSELLSFMALTAGDPVARLQLEDRATAFTGYDRDRDEEAMDSDLYEAALTVAVQDAGGHFLQHLIKVRGEIDDPRFDSAATNAMGANQNPAELDAIHRLALSDDIGSREAYGLIARTLAEPVLRDQNWQWLQRNFPAVLDKIPEQWRRRTPFFARYFCDNQKLAEVRQLFSRYGPEALGYERGLAQTEEQIQLCMALRDKGRALLDGMK